MATYVRKCRICKKYHEFVVFRYYFHTRFFRVYCFKCWDERKKGVKIMSKLQNAVEYTL